ncbi:hypothetical protein BH09PAT2_BH09PAT2_04520 [soil metagenome]
MELFNIKKEVFNSFFLKKASLPDMKSDRPVPATNYQSFVDYALVSVGSPSRGSHVWYT